MFTSIEVLEGDRAAAESRGYDGHHSGAGFKITMFGRAPFFVGVLAQEYQELMNERMRAIPAALLVIVILSFLFHHLALPIPFLIPLVGVAAFGVYRFVGDHDNLKMEIKSHALSCLASAKYDNVTIEQAEHNYAMSLTTYDDHGSQTEAEMIAAMRAHYPVQKAWMDSHQSLLESWQKLRLTPSWPLD